MAAASSAAEFEMRWVNPGRYQLHGELSFASAEWALKQTAAVFAEQSELVFDLAGIAKADSAGLALLLEWRRQAAVFGTDLRYANLPRQLLALARVAGVDEILLLD